MTIFMEDIIKLDKGNTILLKGTKEFLVVITYDDLKKMLKK